jgi:hypothetical protein
MQIVNIIYGQESFEFVWLCVERGAIDENVSPWTTLQDCRDQPFQLFGSNRGPSNPGEQIKIQNMFGRCSLFAILDTHLRQIHVHVINERAVKTRVVRKVRHSHTHNLITAPRGVSLCAIPVNNSSLKQEKTLQTDY